MAASKKKAPVTSKPAAVKAPAVKLPGAKPAAAKKKKSAAGSPASAPAAQAAGAAGPKRLWVVPVAMLLLLAVVGAFVVLNVRHQASLKFDMVREARTIPQGKDRGQGAVPVNFAGDKQGHLFFLESNASDYWRLQRFDQQNSTDTLVYAETKGGKDITNPKDVDVDAAGNVYVILNDGRLQILDNNLKYLRTVNTGIQGPSAVSVNSAGRVYVADQLSNKVVFFNAKGVKEGDFGAPGTQGVPLVAPAHLRVTKEDEIVVIENTETGLRGRIITKDHTLRKTFLVDKIQNAPPVRLGVNAQDMAFFNDPAGSKGIVVWDLKKGEYKGAAQSTKDGEQFISPGCIGADRFTDSVYVHTVSGLIKCALPAAGGDAEEDK